MIKHYQTHIQKKIFTPLNTKGETPLIYFKIFLQKVLFWIILWLSTIKYICEKKSYPYVLRVSHPYLNYLYNAMFKKVLIRYNWPNIIEIFKECGVDRVKCHVIITICHNYYNFHFLNGLSLFFPQW